MVKEQEKPLQIDLPEDAKEKAKEMIDAAFRLFSDHAQNMADELAAFNRKRKEVRERIERGARRTSGRIV
jgi:hypothetical protein